MKKTFKIMKAFVLVVSCIYHYFFSFWIHLWSCQMLTPSDLRQPVWYFQCFVVTGCLLQLLIWSLCIQQSGLSTLGQGWIPPGVGAIISPQAAAAQSRVVCLSRMFAVMGVGSALDLCSYFLSSLPKASVPSLSSSLSGPLCPTFASDLLSLAVSFGCLSGY